MYVSWETIALASAVFAACLAGAWFFRAAQVWRLKSQFKRLEKEKGDLSARLRDAEPAYAAVCKLGERLATMKSVWIDRRPLTKEDGLSLYKLEKSCEIVLRDNLWVLRPELDATPRRNATNQWSIAKILGEHFAIQSCPDEVSKLKLDKAWKPDICGVFDASASVQPRNRGADEIYVIIELKKSGTTIDRADMDQCYAYALALMYRAEPLWGSRIECFVIGEEIRSDVHFIETNVGPDRSGQITITPLTYADLYKRAEQITRILVEAEAEATAPQGARLAA